MLFHTIFIVLHDDEYNMTSSSTLQRTGQMAASGRSGADGEADDSAVHKNNIIAKNVEIVYKSIV